MSLEARIESLENAVVALTEVLKASTSGTAVTAAAGKGSTKADDKKEEGDKAKPARASRSTKSTEPKVPTVKELQTVAQKFLDDAEGNEDAFTERRGKIKDLCEEFKVKRLTEADEADRADIIKALNDFAEENPVEDDDQGGI